MKIKITIQHPLARYTFRTNKRIPFIFNQQVRHDLPQQNGSLYELPKIQKINFHLENISVYIIQEHKAYIIYWQQSHKANNGRLSIRQTHQDWQEFLELYLILILYFLSRKPKDTIETWGQL